jgi:hypothetical protein
MIAGVIVSDFDVTITLLIRVITSYSTLLVRAQKNTQATCTVVKHSHISNVPQADYVGGWFSSISPYDDLSLRSFSYIGAPRALRNHCKFFFSDKTISATHRIKQL